MKIVVTEFDETTKWGRRKMNSPTEHVNAIASRDDLIESILTDLEEVDRNGMLPYALESTLSLVQEFVKNVVRRGGN